MNASAQHDTPKPSPRDSNCVITKESPNVSIYGQIAYNEATDSGGGVYWYNTNYNRDTTNDVLNECFHLESSGTISYNIAENGGGVWAYDTRILNSSMESSCPIIFYGKINYNKGNNGGGVAMPYGYMSFVGTTMLGNTDKYGDVEESSAIYYGDEEATQQLSSGGTLYFTGTTNIVGNIEFVGVRYWYNNFGGGYQPVWISHGYIKRSNVTYYYMAGICLENDWTNSTTNAIGLSGGNSWKSISCYSSNYTLCQVVTQSTSISLKNYFYAYDDRDVAVEYDGTGTLRGNITVLRINEIG